MIAKDISQAKNPLLSMALPALQRAAGNARRMAIEHNTALVIWKDNKVMHISPLELKEEQECYSIK
ncbi:MAG: hypothetical protein RQ899_02235 [Pseudomonadales bacterium]|nr:hypothetical protein [Pseudomonadales bacterium]